MVASRDFGGVICPIVTPFDDHDSIDLNAVTDLVDFLISKGIHGLMVAGSTGEGPLLSLEERKLLTEHVVGCVASRCLVIAHVGCMSTAETVALAQHARDCGADAASAVVPFFFTYDQLSLASHFETAMRSVDDFPFFIYSFPGNAKNDVSPELVRELRSRVPNFVGLKVSSSDLGRVQEYLAAGGDGLVMYTGSDGLMLPSLATGTSGSVSGNANVFPELFCGLYEAFQAGDWARALALQRQINQVRRILRDGLHPAFFKAALSHKGLNGGRVRSPMRELTPEERTELVASLENLGPEFI
ncbi:MAG: dihydrodipicolinate synthase family protein [Anaerolineae bacterium]